MAARHGKRCGPSQDPTAISAGCMSKAGSLWKGGPLIIKYLCGWVEVPETLKTGGFYVLIATK